MTFIASFDATGLFGVYAVEGLAATGWTDSDLNTQFFTNVPDGTANVLIGEVNIAAASVSEPSTLSLFALGGMAVLAQIVRGTRQKGD